LDDLWFQDSLLTLAPKSNNKILAVPLGPFLGPFLNGPLGKQQLTFSKGLEKSVTGMLVKRYCWHIATHRALQNFYRYFCRGSVRAMRLALAGMAETGGSAVVFVGL